MTVMTSATISSGSKPLPARLCATSVKLVEPEIPYSRLKPNSKNAADMPPNRKYFNAASLDRSLRLLNAVRM